MMRYWLLALMMCASQVSAQNLEKETVDVQVQSAPKNLHTLVQFDYQDAVIHGAKLSSDGRLAVVYGNNSDAPNIAPPQKRGLLQIWDVATRKKNYDLAGHADWVTVVLWSHDGERLVSQSQDGQTLLWDVETGQRVAELVPVDPTFARNANGKSAKMTLAQEVRDWMAALDRPQLLGFAGDDSLIYARASRAELTPDVQKTLARNNAVQPTDEEISAVAAARRQSVRVLRSWDARTGMPGPRVDCKAPVGSSFNVRGRMLTNSALNADKSSMVVIAHDIENREIIGTHIEKYDLHSGALLSSFAGAGADKTRFSLLSDDGRRALASIPGDGKHTQLWDVEAQKLLQVLAGGAGTFNNAFFAADNRKLLVGGQAGEILIYDLESGQIEQQLSGGHWGIINTLDMTPDGKFLLSAAYQGNAVQLWDLSAAPVAALQTRLLIGDSNVRQITVAPDGSIWLGWGNLDWGSDARAGKSVELRHISASGEELEKISIPEASEVDQVTFSPDFKLAAGQLSTTSRGMAHGAGVGVWDVVQKKLLWRLPGNNFLTSAMAFAPDSKSLVSGRGDGVVEWWDMQSGKLLRQLFKAASGIEALRFSPDGQTLAIGTLGGTIQMLDMQSGAVREELTEDFAPHDILFSPDGKYLLSGGSIVVNYESTGFKVVLRDLTSKRIVREWQSEGRFFGGVNFLPDGARVAFSHYSDLARMGRAQVEIWDIASNARVGIVPDYSYGQLPVFSPDGKTLFTVGGSWIKSWNLTDVPAQNIP